MDDKVLTLSEAEDLGVRVPSLLTAPPRLTERYPWLYPLAVRFHRTRRRLAWLSPRVVWVRRRSAGFLPSLVKSHASPLLRKLSEAQMALQHGKVTNLRLAAARIDGLLIGPGETFSFNKVVGNCTRHKGYVDGMRLSNGDAEAGVGGGICQLANLLHWMFLHSPLTVVERSEHSFDPFPDKGRVLPWGVGCSIAYNYVDLVVRNDTDRTFQLRVWVDTRHLRGKLLADRPLATAYHVEARKEGFLGYRGRVYRHNEIWRTLIDRRTGQTVGEELVRRNCAVVKYQPEGVVVLQVAD